MEHILHTVLLAASISDCHPVAHFHTAFLPREQADYPQIMFATISSRTFRNNGASPRTMTLFFLNLRRRDEAPKLIASCSIVGERRGFSSRERGFDDAGAARQALEAAGVERSRLEYVFGPTHGDSARTLELTQMQAYSLGVLRLEDTE